MAWELPGPAIDAALERAMDGVFYPLAPGVEGATRDWSDGTFELVGIRAVTPGAGDVGRYLDSLPRDRTVVVPFVTSQRLTQMLARRGFVPFDPVNSHWIR